MMIILYHRFMIVILYHCNFVEFSIGVVCHEKFILVHCPNWNLSFCKLSILFGWINLIIGTETILKTLGEWSFQLSHSTAHPGFSSRTLIKLWKGGESWWKNTSSQITQMRKTFTVASLALEMKCPLFLASIMRLVLFFFVFNK